MDGGSAPTISARRSTLVPISVAVLPILADLWARTAPEVRAEIEADPTYGPLTRTMLAAAEVLHTAPGGA